MVPVRASGSTVARSDAQSRRVMRCGVSRAPAAAWVACDPPVSICFRRLCQSETAETPAPSTPVLPGVFPSNHSPVPLGIVRAIPRADADVMRPASETPMQKLLLISVLIATIAVPALMARKGAPVAYVPVLKQFLVVVGIYVFLLLVVYPRLF